LINSVAVLEYVSNLSLLPEGMPITTVVTQALLLPRRQTCDQRQGATMDRIPQSASTGWGGSTTTSAVQSCRQAGRQQQRRRIQQEYVASWAAERQDTQTDVHCAPQPTVPTSVGYQPAGYRSPCSPDTVSSLSSARLT